MKVTRIHHLNCGSMHAYVPNVQTIVYCLLLETDDGLVLVDTGFGTQDYTKPTRPMRAFTALLRIPRDVEETAARQVMRLGYAVEDVRHIVLTHLHLDHAGGLPDFPHAHVHIFRPEYEAAMQSRGWTGYVQQHWAHNPKWVIHDRTGETWFDFEGIAISDDLWLIPLPGHTPGHCGVAIKSGDGWLLHCGDAASPFHGTTDPNCPIDKQPSWLVKKLIGPHIPRLRRFAQAHSDEVRLISGHDIDSFKEFVNEDTDH